ncbi:MAG: TMEM43 family protein [Verrucomicrobiales bacterium]|nr:TMEM43 family protein [Verrucomicrobiales bacterium]
MSEFTTVTRKGWGTRSKNSIGGAIFGFFLAALAVGLLFWNEGRAVKRYKDLKEGAGVVVTTDSASVDAAVEGKLVHTTGEAKTSGPLSDQQFGVSENAIKLIRSAEMYQWVESERTEKSTSTGGTETTRKTYSYSKTWKPGVVNSSNFKVSNGHENPAEMKYKSTTLVADGVTLGAYRLPEFLVKQIGGATPLTINSVENATPEIKATGKLHNGGIYFGADPINPQVGDIRVKFSIVQSGPISVIAQKQGDTFTTYQTKTGGKLSLLDRGTLSSDQMFTQAHESNKILTWAIRIGGFFMLGFAFSMILGPLSVFASVLPFLGRIVETGTTIIGFLLAGVVWTIVVAIAWIFYRPLLGIAILVVTVGLTILIIRKLRSGKAAENTAPPLDTPPPLT